MSRSRQTFRPVPAVQLLGIMLRNRHWPTTFHTIILQPEMPTDGVKTERCDHPLGRQIRGL